MAEEAQSIGSHLARPPIDDSIPADAGAGFDDTGGPPAPPPQPRQGVLPPPGAEDVLAVMRSFIGIGEDPPGSNCNAITQWYDGGCAQWCAETISKAFFDAGFNDGAGTWDMPGIVPTTARGFAWVPAIRDAFTAAGRYDMNGGSGDIAIVGDAEHVCIVEFVDGDGAFNTIEGNFSDDCLRNRRTTSITGFCHPPYGGGTPGNGWPGVYLRRGDKGAYVHRFQERMADMGKTITVDGDFGPETEGVVLQFQTASGLEADGIIGPHTWNAAFDV